MKAAARYATYRRISSDPEHDELGVTRQRKDCAALVTDRGGLLVDEFVDNDISATKGAPREGYAALMALAESKGIDAIVVWQTSRLWRNRRERADGIGRLAEARVSIVPVKGPELDLSSAHGRMIAGILGEFDTAESEVKAERNRSKARELADAGKIGAGGARPYGYRRIFSGEGRHRKIVRDELEPAEADVIQELARRVIEGDTIRSVTAWLNESGHRSSTGQAWAMQAVRHMLRSGRIAGLREFHREVIGKAVWPAIITEEQHLQLRQILTRRPGHRTFSGRKHAMTGFIYCGGCKTVRMQVGGPDGTEYRCHLDIGCGRAVKRAPLEEMIARYVVGRLDVDAFRVELAMRQRVGDSEEANLIAAIDDDDRRLIAMGAALETVDADSVPEAFAAIAAIRKRVASARARLGHLAGVPAAVRDAVGITYEEFLALGLDAKRGLLDYLVDRVTVGPAVRGLNRFDPRRVDILPG